MNCLVCERALQDRNRPYHPHCAQVLFGSSFVPAIGFAYADIPTEAQKLIGKMSISGVQPKLSVVVNKDEKRFSVVPTGGTHILKPTPEAFPFLSENENLCMNLSREMGIETPPHGLVKMADDRLAYVIRRFDRDTVGNKIPVEDFAQLLGKTDKYDGSVEQIGKFLKRHSCVPFIDTQKLFVRILFFFLMGNGDAHLKNFAFVWRPAGYRLADGYDIVSSRLAFAKESDEMAITVGGRKNRLVKKDFEDLAKYLEIADRQRDRFFEMARALGANMGAYVRNSFLPQKQRDELMAIFQERFARLF
ncbi:MAG: HipA domain-containing protein [Deltaproteobacteria bacterium]|nr:HipA domain-containing protein [Deltaproteobacteria bacterium]